MTNANIHKEKNKMKMTSMKHIFTLESCKITHMQCKRTKLKKKNKFEK